MTHILRELKLIRQKEFDKKEPVREFIKAVIVSHEGNIRVPGHPEKVYTSELGNSQSLIPAINYTVPDTEGLPVILGWLTKPQHQERIIISIDANVSTSVSFGGYSTPEHGMTHEWSAENLPGSDPVRVFQPALMPLKTLYDPTTLTVTLSPLKYVSGRRVTSFPGQQVDLTTYLPSSGNIRYVLVCLNKSTNTAEVIVGDEISTSLTPHKPEITNSLLEPSALITLTFGQTGITASEYEDARNFVGADTVTISSNRVGEIGYSEDGITLGSNLPVVNDYGILVNKQGIIVVI